MKNSEIIRWLLSGDISIQYQVYRDLFGEERHDLQNRIAKEGWGARLLSRQKENGHWGRGFYQTKWISTHYTLLDLKNLGISPGIPQARQAVRLILEKEKAEDGGVNPAATIPQSDICVNGMFLNYACYFEIEEGPLHSIIDYMLSQRMPDGGFNCRFNRGGARHSSLHTTLSILEGFQEYEIKGYRYRLPEVREAVKSSREFILVHRLYLSDRTGKVINPAFLRIPYPSRWKYDILRGLDYFRATRLPYDERIQPAIEVLLKKRRKDLTWPLQAPYPGKVHFEMEKAGAPSRWNTLRALRVLNHFKIEYY